jgi:hypothetical protein
VNKISQKVKETPSNALSTSLLPSISTLTTRSLSSKALKKLAKKEKIAKRLQEEEKKQNSNVQTNNKKSMKDS